MSNKWAGNEASQVINANRRVDQAYIEQAQSNAPDLIRKVTIDLTTAATLGNPKKLSFAYRSVYVSEATDSSVTVDLYVNSDKSSVEGFPLSSNDSLSFDHSIKNAFLTWSAQSGKTITLIFILDGEFRPGSLFTQVSSAVEGNTFTPQAPITLTTTYQTIIAQDLTRTVLNLICDTEWVITNSTATYYFPVAANTPLVLKNTAAFKAKVLSGTGTLYMAVES